MVNTFAFVINRKNNALSFIRIKFNFPLFEIWLHAMVCALYSRLVIVFNRLAKVLQYIAAIVFCSMVANFSNSNDCENYCKKLRESIFSYNDLYTINISITPREWQYILLVPSMWLDFEKRIYWRLGNWRQGLRMNSFFSSMIFASENRHLITFYGKTVKKK